MWKYICDNYKWLFSGIGVLVIVMVVNSVNNLKEEPGGQDQLAASGDSSTVLDSEPSEQSAQNTDREPEPAWDWLANNYKWLFSGIGVVIFLAVVNFLRVKVKAKPGGQSAIHDKADAIVIREPEEVQTTPPNQSHGGLAGELTPEGIIQEINSAPMLQQGTMAESFRGITVNWTGRLHSLEPQTGDRDKVQVHIGVGDPEVSVFCYLEKSEYPGLGVLRRGHQVQVSGKIEKADTYIIRLTDASISY